MRVLLVEDDDRLASSVANQLRQAGFAVDTVARGEDALRESAISPYDAIVLDLQLPDLDGVEICRQLRARGTPVRIIMATARDGVADRITGLDTGADDYLVKPYSVGELIARLRALLRRPEAALPTVYRVADLELDTATRVARRGNRTIDLTTKEFVVLEYMMRNAGRVLTREQISEHAWDANYDPFSNVIDVYVARLRRKVDAPGEPALIETVRGAGYRLAAPAESHRR
ncbi:MAG TPA: response regulator transcription factor [Gemmatimonadaceae bacterium]|nr:response regulator transcription factor [Gemmatimonadaceae bacterium]